MLDPKFKHIISTFNFNLDAYPAPNEGYVRYSLARNAEFELLLLCWAKSSFAPMHGHSTTNSYLRIISGQIQDESYSFDEDGYYHSIKVLNSGDFTFLPAHSFHSIKALDVTRALHIYTPLLAFNEDTCEILLQELKSKKLNEINVV